MVVVMRESVVIMMNVGIEMSVMVMMMVSHWRWFIVMVCNRLIYYKIKINIIFKVNTYVYSPFHLQTCTYCRLDKYLYL